MLIGINKEFSVMEWKNRNVFLRFATVLQSIPWDKVDIQVLVIEVHYVGKIFDNGDETVESFLSKQGYKLLQKLGINQIFVKNDFEVHKLKKPFVRYFNKVV